MSLSAVRVHLGKQFDVESARIVEHHGVRCVRAVISNELSDGSNFRRIVYYDREGDTLSL